MEYPALPARRERNLAAFLALCLITAGCAQPAPTPAPAPTQPTTFAYTPTVPPATPSSTATASPVPEEACVLSADEREEMRTIENEVATLRGLSPRAPQERVLLDAESLRGRVEADMLEDYTEQEAAKDALLFSLLGWIEPEVDLRQLYADLMAEQAAGFYDPEADEMVVLCGTEFGGLERLTYAHEYDHTLVDQAYDPTVTLNYADTDCESAYDRCLAAQALLEGDASLLQEQWLRTFGSQQDLTDILAFFDRFEMPIYDQAPEYIRAELTFPYLQGLLFVHSIYLQNGWAAVDSLYQNPPLSSEQILHPERYPRDLPVKLSVPDLQEKIGNGWRELARDTFGEWNTYMLLLGPLEEDAASRGADGWGGDFILLFQENRTGEGALLLVTQWDTLRDAREFVDAFRRYGTERFGELTVDTGSRLEWTGVGSSSLLLRQSNQTLWILAPDDETLNTLRSAIQLPLWPTP
jgi:hypothetical protein